MKLDSTMWLQIGRALSRIVRPQYCQQWDIICCPPFLLKPSATEKGVYASSPTTASFRRASCLVIFRDMSETVIRALGNGSPSQRIPLACQRSYTIATALMVSPQRLSSPNEGAQKFDIGWGVYEIYRMRNAMAPAMTLVGYIDIRKDQSSEIRDKMKALP